MRKIPYIVFGIICFGLVLFAVVFYTFVYPLKFKNAVSKYSSQFEIDEALVYAIMKAESGFNVNAVSKSGAIGLMQILPSTAEWMSEQQGTILNETDLFDAETNIYFGCCYLSYLFSKFGNSDIVICAYNAGERKVIDWIDKNGELDVDKIDYAETKNYLSKVKKYYSFYKAREFNM